MKTQTKLITFMSIAIGICWVSTTAKAGGWGGRGGWGCGRGGWGWGWGVPVGVSFYYSSPDYYYYPPAYYSAPPVVYSSPPPVVSGQQPAPQTYTDSQQPQPDQSASPTTTARDPNPEPSTASGAKPVEQSKPTQAPSVADVKTLAKTQIGDEIIISLIRNSHAVFRLTTNEIIDLKNSHVSEKVIDFMINTPSAGR